MPASRVKAQERAFGGFAVAIVTRFEKSDLSIRLADALSRVRERHDRPLRAETQIDGNTVTCTSSTVSRPDPARSGSTRGDPDAEAYVHEAVAAVVKITRQRVSRFSSYRREPHETVEIFTLESTMGRGRPRSGGRHPAQ